MREPEGVTPALIRNVGAAGMIAALLAAIAWPSELGADPVLERLQLAVYFAGGLAVGAAASAARDRLRGLPPGAPRGKRLLAALTPAPVALLALVCVGALCAAATPPAPPRAVVLVAAENLGAGAVLEGQALAERAVPPELAGPGAVPAEARAALEGARTLVPLRAGEPVLLGLTSRSAALCPSSR